MVRCLGICEDQRKCKRIIQHPESYCWQHRHQERTRELCICAANGYRCNLEDTRENRVIVSSIRQMRSLVAKMTMNTLGVINAIGEVDFDSKIKKIEKCMNALYDLQSALDEHREIFDDEFIRAECDHTRTVFRILNEYKDFIGSI